jgi:peptidoglycan/xylan/chitin deacetylase (PgdA/CDA1 family)
MADLLTIPCLVYHRLHRGAGPEDRLFRAFSISLESFQDHLTALQNEGYQAVPLNDFPAWQKGASSPPARPIFITFDDGWESNVLAWRELRGRGMTCDIFVTADREAPVFKEGKGIDRPLSEEEIRQLAAEGVGTQSHGWSHRPFTELPEENLQKELFESKKGLEKLAGQPVNWLAAPYGLSNRRVEAAARQAGYQGFAQGLAGLNTLRQNPFCLKRIGVSASWSGEELLARLTLNGIKGLAKRKNYERRVRIFLGQKWSARLRALKQGRLTW